MRYRRQRGREQVHADDLDGTSGKTRLLLSAVIHEDGTVRAQLVSRADNPLYYELISEFEAISGAPLLLNTSFNDSEPIVCSPHDAIKPS